MNHFMSLNTNILFVDDEVFFRTILNDGLRDRYNIIEAENGKEGVALALKHIG